MKYIFFTSLDERKVIFMYSAGKSRQPVLFVKGFDLRQWSTGLGRLMQMETKSVSVRLYTEQACYGSPTRHSGSSSAFNSSTEFDRYTGTNIIRDQRTIVIHATYHINYKDGAVSSCVNRQELARTLGQDVVSLTVSAGRKNRVSLHA